MHFKAKEALPLILLLAAWLMSCADVPSTGPTPPALISQFRFLHAAGDLGSIGVAVDGSSIGSIAFEGALPYTEFPSGARVAVLSNGDTLRVAMESYKRGTVVILPKTGPVREFMKLSERRVFDPVNTNLALVRIVHAAEAPDLDVRIAGPDTTITLRALSYRSATEYLQIPAANYTIIVSAAGSTTALLTSTLSAVNKRQTSVLMGSTSANTAALVNFTDD